MERISPGKVAIVSSLKYDHYYFSAYNETNDTYEQPSQSSAAQSESISESTVAFLPTRRSYSRNRREPTLFIDEYVHYYEAADKRSKDNDPSQSNTSSTSSINATHLPRRSSTRNRGEHTLFNDEFVQYYNVY